MKISIFENSESLGEAAGKATANAIRDAIFKKGYANIILATGTSQFETIRQLIREPGIDWGKVSMFHLDEYIGLPESHPASFRKYLKERFIRKVAPLKAAYLINGETDPMQECKRLGELIRQHPIDLALVGIGENGHLAFNDPPADFDTNEAYIIANLDLKCREQQMNEGWFTTLHEVPARAISMSIKQILQSDRIICSVPDQRKARAVKNSLEGPINAETPASMLQQHADCVFYLDTNSASLMENVV
ncbi:glucosamine-6-phosphate deaminase [Parapedobacter tibetensis]|uniref:glucosamine-6-phosphate deaminase n=1 Tax=Parapedobacter tibetensis TaxID=2972951 RepID=UPI00214DCEAF|nr:glucosamine-6-phosphate deaminase [Parapedobacter tibetensis]